MTRTCNLISSIFGKNSTDDVIDHAMVEPSSAAIDHDDTFARLAALPSAQVEDDLPHARSVLDELVSVRDLGQREAARDGELRSTAL